MDELQSIFYNIISSYTHQWSSEFFNKLKDYLVTTLPPADTYIERQLNGEWGSVGIYIKNNFEKESCLFLGHREAAILVLKETVGYIKNAIKLEDNDKEIILQLNALIYRLSI